MGNRKKKKGGERGEEAPSFPGKKMAAALWLYISSICERGREGHFHDKGSFFGGEGWQSAASCKNLSSPPPSPPPSLCAATLYSDMQLQKRHAHNDVFLLKWRRGREEEEEEEEEQEQEEEEQEEEEGLCRYIKVSHCASTTTFFVLRPRFFFLFFLFMGKHVRSSFFSRLRSTFFPPLPLSSFNQNESRFSLAYLVHLCKISEISEWGKKKGEVGVERGKILL